MSLGELLVTFLVALLVFGPTKLPMLAEHLGKLMRYFNQMKDQLSSLIQMQLNEQKRLENTKKAEQADIIYQSRQGEKNEGID